MLEKILIKPALPLLSACFNGELDNVKSILNSDLSHINKTEDNSLTAIAFAVLNGHYEITHYLISHGADISKTYSQDSYKGIPLLHFAILGGNERIVELLVEKGTDITTPIEQTNITPMAVAVENGKIKIARYLVNHGAMPYLEFPQPFKISPQYAKFFQDQIAYRARGDWEGILRDFYVEDPVMISYDFVLRGREAIMNHFIEGNSFAGKLLAFSVESYMEGEGVMIMRSNVLSENTLTKACDSYYFEGDRVKLFFAHTSSTDWSEKTKNWALKWMF